MLSSQRIQKNVSGYILKETIGEGIYITYK